MQSSAHERAIGKITQLSATCLDLATFWQDVTEVLSTSVPFYWTPCWYTLDPTSLLITSHYHDGLPEFPEAWLTEEYFGDDVHTLIAVARSDAGLSTLHEATGGDPSGTRRWQANIELGGDQELIAALRSRDGKAWGALGLYREPGRPMFDERDKVFLRAATPLLADGARRSLVIGEAVDPETPDAPALLVLDGAGDVDSRSPGADRWLAELPDGDPQSGRLPSSVRSVAAQARANGVTEARGSATPAVARVQARSGAWLVVQGASLLGHEGPRVAVTIEPAHPARIIPLLMAAYGLTERERDVTLLVLQGGSTREVARRLSVSEGTVQQHLKSIFAKTGVRSRRELVGRVFFAHYEPRFRDNEQRTQRGAPMRGGPVIASTATSTRPLSADRSTSGEPAGQP